MRVYRNPFVTYTVRLLVTIIYSQSVIDINIVGVIQQCVREDHPRIQERKVLLLLQCVRTKQYRKISAEDTPNCPAKVISISKWAGESTDDNRQRKKNNSGR